VKLIADIDKSHVVFERHPDLGNGGAVNVVDKLSDEGRSLIEIDRCGIEGRFGRDLKEVFDKGATRSGCHTLKGEGNSCSPLLRKVP
jgi:hypothetical protein